MKKYLSRNTYSTLRAYAKSHKIISTIIAIAILGTGYYTYGKLTSTSGETRYVTAIAKKQTIISTVSGSGQVSTTNQIEVKAKVSGDITWVNVKPGDKVYAGQALAGIDNRTAKASIANAEASLIQSKLQFQKDEASAPIDYQKNVDDLAIAKNDLVNSYNDTFNSLSTTYLDLPNIVVGMQNTLYGYDLSSNRSQVNLDVLVDYIQDDKSKIIARNFADISEKDYKIAREKYDKAVIKNKQTSRTSSPEQIGSLLTESIDTTTAIAQALQSELNLLGTVIDLANQFSITLPSTVNTLQTNTRTRLSTVNNDLSSLLSQKKSLDSIKQTIKTNEQNIELLKVGNETGSNPISLQISKNDLIKQERSLEDLKLNLSYYTVTAPFAGTVSSVTAQLGQSAGTIATIVTNQKVAQLSVNEIDAAKIKLGQKATLTFDAIDTLSLTGTVNEIDPVGTVSQGVVSYNLKITFDSQDERIKPGMTVNADIQTDIHADVVSVPSSAVKTSNGVSRVQVFNPAIAESGTAGTVSEVAPVQVTVTIGISDDLYVEILSGLEEGEQVVSRTITGTGAQTPTAPSATSLLGGGTNRGGAGGVRIGG